MNQRLTITLPEGTVQLTDRTIPKRERSLIINEAVQQYLRNAARKRLRDCQMLNQIRSVDNRRLKRRLFMVSPETMKRVDEALSISLGLTDLGR
ncbi:MAG: type II toxin-antitoxin system PemK/MazF family toxin [Candidatus Omnitrophica bacterium]|nr:type II toxin-antitoxin system PemK/MazF family toxin [Candidatus Omnitrophota bacterium]